MAHLPPTDRSQNPSLGFERGFGGTVSIAADSGVETGPSAPGKIAGPAQAVAASNPAGPAQAAASSDTAHAGEDPGGHGIAADCGEPWKIESRQMAAALADTFLHASELQGQLNRKEAEPSAAADAVIEARGQSTRAQSIGEMLHEVKTFLF